MRVSWSYPTGVRDGTSSVGNFTARTQFFQTFHNKRLIGGYLSRVSRARVSEVRDDDIVDALFTLSEGGELPEDVISALLEQGPSFIREREHRVRRDRLRQGAETAA